MVKSKRLADRLQIFSGIESRWDLTDVLAKRFAPFENLSAPYLLASLYSAPGAA